MAHRARRLSAISLAVSFACGCSAESSSPLDSRGGSSGAPEGSGGATGGRAGEAGSAAGSGGSGGTVASSCKGTQADFDAFAAKVGADLAAHDVVGGGLAIVCGGTTIYATGLGLAEKGGAPVAATTRFQLASATKSLTAALAVRLAEQGALSLDDPVSKWLPYVNTQAPYDRGFTLAELLSHTSGYPAGIDTANYSDLEASFQQNANVKLWSPPGEVFDYSNDGYAMAGLLLQTAAGKAFASLIEDEVMKPAGMQHASMNAQAVQNEGDFATGYSSWDGLAYKPTDGYLATPYYGPMGGAWASAEDLAHFAQTLLSNGGTLFGKDSLAKLTEDRTRTTWGARHYGLGMFVDDLSGSPMWGHDGSVAGFLSSYSIIFSRGFAIVMLVNSDAYMPDPYLQIDEAATIFTGSPPAWSGDGGMFDPADEPDHVGSYQSNTLGTMTVQKSGDQMQIMIGGQTQPLDPAWKDTYFFNYQLYDVDASFWRMSGTVKYLVTPFGVGARTN